MSRTGIFLTIAAVALGSGAAVRAQQDDDQAAGTAEPACELRGENGMVTMLLCPEGLTAEALAAEGRLACGERKPCGAWIWTKESAVPDAAPASHDAIPGESVRNAVAIWMNESGQLISLQKVAKE